MYLPAVDFAYGSKYFIFVGDFFFFCLGLGFFLSLVGWEGHIRVQFEDFPDLATHKIRHP